MSERREIIQTEKTNLASINLRDDGITEIVFIEEYEIEIPDIKEIQNAFSRIDKPQGHFVLVVPGPAGSISKEAREEPMFGDHLNAVAIVTKMLHQRLLGNLFFRIRRSEFDNYRLFKNKEEAEKWLKEQVKSVKGQS